MTVHYREGDATQPISTTGESARLVAHIVNTNFVWGKGFVLAVSAKWPEARSSYLDWRGAKLGDTQFVESTTGLIVANMMAQYLYTPYGQTIPLQYGSLKKCLEQVAKVARVRGATVHMPRIGCGIAGGSWPRVLPLLEAHTDITWYVYDLA